MLFRATESLTVDFMLEAIPGRLVMVDFTIRALREDGGENKLPFRLCGLYAPIKANERRDLWEHLKAYCNTRRHVIVAGDFNNRVVVSDRMTYVDEDRTTEQSAARPLTVEERELERFFIENGLSDKATEATNVLDFFPVTCRRAFIYRYSPMDGARYTFYHTRGASRLDRIRASKELKTDRCRLIVTPWSDRLMLSCDFSTGQVYPRGKPLWRLTTKQLNDISCKEMLASTLANMLTLCDLYEDDLAAWWERCKRIVRKRCWSLDVRINSKEVKTYQEAVYQFVKCHSRVNRGLPYDKQLLQRSREVIVAFQMRQRQKKRNAKLYRTKGALVDKDEWVRARTQAPFESMKGLRLSEDDAVSLRPDEMLDVVKRYYTQIYREKPIRGEEIRNFFDSLPQRDLNLIHRGLVDEDLRELEKPITEEEKPITSEAEGNISGRWLKACMLICLFV
ncbi:uncharacterized protein LOC123017843 isoform X2 [Varanus komodoensis]|uniref:uncharacterized protein LOC123017843 isoform X1 n=1 Tax=Varanus komodoensis TaxID=61221 RepID=UPI001CF7CB38|nr:uncharacterized protein LOC123017843 isoform X1 [Varanus komodoensis]XP_044275392.1 uncharacterized protein LOC123017843 isoform X2 [Varanus komodoensis]